MNPLLTATTIARIVRRGEGRELLRELRRRAYANDMSYILRRDLQAPLSPKPQAGIPITVRPLRSADIPLIVAGAPAPIARPASQHRELLSNVIRKSPLCII